MDDIARFYLLARPMLPPKQKLPPNFDQNLAAAIQDLEKRWPDLWVTPLATHAHGEVVGVMTTPRYAFDLWVGLSFALWPTPWMAHLSTHPAGLPEKEEAIFSLKLPMLSDAAEGLILASARLYADLLKDWKPSRAAAAVMIRKANTQKDAAATLGIRQQSVSEALRAAHAKDLVSHEDAMRTYLATLET